MRLQNILTNALQNTIYEYFSALLCHISQNYYHPNKHFSYLIKKQQKDVDMGSFITHD